MAETASGHRRRRLALWVYLVGSAGIGLGIGLWLFVTGHLPMGLLLAAMMRE